MLTEKNLKSDTRKAVHSQLVFMMVKSQSNNKARERKKRDTNGGGRNQTISPCKWHGPLFKLSLCVSDLVLSSREPTTPPESTTGSFSKVAGHKINIKRAPFLHTKYELAKHEVGKITPPTIDLKSV